MSAFFTPLDGAVDTTALLKGSTLLFPAVSIGSVPQLAVDLLLHNHSLQLRKIGRIDSTFFIPFVGPVEAAAGDKQATLATALEVFANSDGLVVVQQRAPVLKSRQHDFLIRLTQWIEAAQVVETLWISSIDADARTDAELQTPILSLFPSGAESEITTPVLTRLKSLFPPLAPSSTARATTAIVPHVPGALLTRKFIQKAVPNSAALLFFASEGDTRPLAHQLAQTIISLLLPPPALAAQKSPAELQEPSSWQYLFGNPPDSALYG